MDVAAELLLPRCSTRCAPARPRSAWPTAASPSSAWLPSTAVSADRLAAALAAWTAFPQRGEGLAERLAFSHLDLAAEQPGPVVQICMDTPQVTEADLTEVSRARRHDAVLADAEHGGWWALALADPRRGEHLVGVPMSTPTTGAATGTASRPPVGTVGRGRVLRDVDVADDAVAERVRRRLGLRHALEASP